MENKKGNLKRNIIVMSVLIITVMFGVVMVMAAALGNTNTLVSSPVWAGPGAEIYILDLNMYNSSKC